MKPLFFIIGFLGALGVYGQISPDSVVQQIDQVVDKIRFDTLTSLKQSLQIPDSLKRPFHQADSIRSAFVERSGELKNKYDSTMSGIANQSSRVNKAIDSLENLNLPTAKYTRKLDSLNSIASESKAKLSEQSAKLKAQTTDKLKSLDLPPQYQEPIQKLTESVDGFSLDADMPAIGELKLDGYDLPKFEGIKDLSLKGDLPGIGKLPSIETPVGDLGKIGDGLKGYHEDIRNITDGNLSDVQQLPKTLEEQASRMEGIDELQKQTGAMNEMQSKIEGLNDPEAAKKQAVEMAKKVAVDHFAGKEEQLKAAMDKLSKYKKKYSSVSSIKDLPKRAPNAMKGKPLRERIIPGFYFQYQQRNDRLFDFNPYVSYRLSGRFTTGLGYNHRFVYDTRTHEWMKKSAIYGPRAFVDFRLGKGFIGHLEGETMNTFVPFALRGNPDIGKREWVWGMMLGLKKEYKVYKNLRGTVLLQYNLFTPFYKAPYVDRLNSRIGFEYLLKKRKRKIQAVN